MGKRKRNIEEEYDKIKKKMKKLEKKLERRRIKSNSSPLVCSTPPTPTAYEDVEIQSENEEVQPTLPSFIAEPIPSTSTNIPLLSSTPLESHEDISIEEPSPTSLEHPQVDNEILDILGEDPSIVKEFGKDIQSDLAIRLQHVATKGLSKEIRKELQDRYLPPSNCKLIDAPLLNPEARAAVSEVVLKRDKGIELKQKQLGSAISCIGEVLTRLMEKENKDTSTIKTLMDAVRLICDCQHQDSSTRRNFISFNIKKEMRDQLQKKEIDTFLFGSNLTDTIKTAKDISKSGTELRSSGAKLPPTKNRQLPANIKQNQFPQRNNLNWKAPPPSRRQKGTQRTREPAPRNQQGNSSRPSYRQPPSTGRNRR